MSSGPLFSFSLPNAGRLPAPRKLPSQSRSRSLVAALIEACIRILETEGSAALTINRLAELSGVAVGSIYQYFPNKEAVVSLAFNHILYEEAQVAVPALRARVDGLDLRGALSEILRDMLRIELRLHRLHAEFHLRYHPELQVGMRVGPYASSRDYVEQAWLPFVEIYAPTLPLEQREMRAYMLGISLRSMIRQTLEDEPERVEAEAFFDALLVMALALLQIGPAVALSQGETA